MDDDVILYSSRSSLTNNLKNTVHSFISIIWYGSNESLEPSSKDHYQYQSQEKRPVAIAVMEPSE